MEVTVEQKTDAYGITIRPFQLMCYVCTLGETGSRPTQGRLGAIRDAIASDPDTPITLVCNAGSIFSFQDPGTQEDTPEGADFNLKRDMDILHKMDLVPGSTLPARMMFLRLLDRISTSAGICGYDTVTSPAWQGPARRSSPCTERSTSPGPFRMRGCCSPPSLNH